MNIANVCHIDFSLNEFSDLLHSYLIISEFLCSITARINRILQIDSCVRSTGRCYILILELGGILLFFLKIQSLIVRCNGQDG